MLVKGSISGVLTHGSLPGPRGFTWGFVALEYYALILNRVMAVLFSSNDVVIVRVGGVVAAPQPVHDIHFKPLAYVTPGMADRYSSIAMESDELLEIDRANRKLPLSEVIGARFEHRRKWGMGTVPYSGIVYLQIGASEREFVLLGDQDGAEIASLLNRSLRAKN